MYTQCGVSRVIPELTDLLAVVNRCLSDAEKQIDKQRGRIDELKAKGEPTIEEEKTLDVMLVVALSMKDNQAMIQVQISALTVH